MKPLVTSGMSRDVQGHRSIRSNSIFSVQEVFAVGFLMVIDGYYKLLLITYNLSLLFTTVYQVIWLRAIVKSCVSPSILRYCSMVSPLYFPQVFPLFADLSKGNMGLSEKKVPRNLDGRSVDHRSDGPYPETVKDHQFGIPIDIIDRYIKIYGCVFF